MQTDQDAFEVWASEHPFDLQHPKRVWSAALAWLRSQHVPLKPASDADQAIYKGMAQNYFAPQPAWRKADDEIESGVGIRWVSDTGIHGRPTAHDVREYLERRGESAKCGCDKCTAPQPAIPDGWQLVPKEPTQAMLDATWCDDAVMKADGCDGIRAALYRAMIAAAPKPGEPA